MTKRVLFAGTLFLLCMVAGTAAIAVDVTYKTYTDKKFGYSVEYPDIYNEVGSPVIDGDGNSVFGAHKGGGEYMFQITGGKKPKKATGDSLLKDATNMEEDKNGYVYGVEPLPGTAKSGADFYTLDYADDSAGPDGVTHVYGVVGKNVTVKYEIRYPKGEAERFAPIIKRMDASLKVK